MTRGLLAALSALLVYLLWNPGLGYTGDDARMMLEAQQMSTGVWPGQGGVQSTPLVSHIGLVALLAPLSHSMFLMHSLIALMFIGCVVLTYDLASFCVNEHRAVFAALLLATSGMALSYAVQVMTEVPFLFLTLGALCLARRDRFALAMLLALLSMSVRSIGITLVVALAVQGSLRVSWPVRGLGAAVLFGAALLANQTHSIFGSLALLRGGPYEDTITWSELPGRVAGNALAYLTDYIPLVIFPRNNGAWAFLGIALMVACIVGLRRERLFLGYLGVYGAVLLVYPESLSGTRYVVPLLPLFLIGLVSIELGVCEMRWKAAVVCAVSLTAMLLVPLIRLGGFPPPQGFLHYYQLASGMRTLPSGSIIACRKANSMRVLSGHMAKMYPFNSSVPRWLVEQEITHVVIDQMATNQTGRWLLPAVAHEGVPLPGFKKVFNHNGTWLLEVE